jgi:hypothetical protein
LLRDAIAALTFGTLNSKELTFQENLLIAGYRNMAFAVAAGMPFNFANMPPAAAELARKRRHSGQERRSRSASSRAF